MKVVNYLDVTLNLNDGTYKPYRKENNDILYINAKSNHPPSIIKQLPLSIENRLSKLSSSEKEFKESVDAYQEALNKGGYNHILKYSATPQSQTKSTNRKRKIIWFNPPYSQSVETNIGKYFLNLIDKHFPRHHKFYKLFNRNTLKISYSCMMSISNHINLHNRKILHPKSNNPNQVKKLCNCSNATMCPLNGNCLDRDILYECSVSCDIPNYMTKVYTGISSTVFKSRYGNHKLSFNNPKYKNDTELSKEFWKIKEKGGTPKLAWKVLGRYSSYNPVSKRCNLCLNEKFTIISYKGSNLLNSRSEVISKCRHKNRYKLSSLTSENIT